MLLDCVTQAHHQWALGQWQKAALCMGVSEELYLVSGCRGGLIKWADLVGPKHVAARLEGWAKQFEGAGLAGFFKPCAYLAAAAKNGTQLSAGVSPDARL